MKKILIFSGTTEGRELSGMLSKKEIQHNVCVASKYGSDMMDSDDIADIHIGRMDACDMIDYLSELGFSADDLIIDATHPYAGEVTDNIKKAASVTGCRLIRIVRADEKLSYDKIKIYDSLAECAEALNSEKGNILLTTGSKELKKYSELAGKELMSRTYVRVLPSVESLDICALAGVDSKRIIAMNKALMLQYDIRHIVTKESGVPGGFEEKINAARDLGVQCHVISRPVKEEGMDIYQAYRYITGEDYKKDERLTIRLIGVGVGAERLLSIEAGRYIEEAQLVFGAKRLIENIRAKKKYDMYLAKDIIPAIQKEKDISRIAVLFSGDSGFYSGAKAMYGELKRWNGEADIGIFPGISSVSYLAARLGESYDDAAIVSLHGRNDNENLLTLADKVRFNRKTFVLLSGAEDIRNIGKILSHEADTCMIYVGKDLSYDNESIEALSVTEAIGYDVKGILTALIVNEGFRSADRSFGR